MATTPPSRRLTLQYLPTNRDMPEPAYEKVPCTMSLRRSSAAQVIRIWRDYYTIYSPSHESNDTRPLLLHPYDTGFAITETSQKATALTIIILRHESIAHSGKGPKTRGHHPKTTLQGGIWVGFAVSAAGGHTPLANCSIYEQR